MTDRELLQQALDALHTTNFGVHARAVLALSKRLAHCDRCGKQLGGVGHIHTCTPPAAQMTEFEQAVAACDNTLHFAINHWQDKAVEQAALLRECRFALDELIKQKPMLTSLLCGSNTLGNLRASLYDYQPQAAHGIKENT
jgi:hypothetical protein